MKRIDWQRMLLVDDETEVRECFVMLLERAGATVIEAPSGARALELYRSETLDCVVTDYNMPEMKGDALARAIKSIQPTQRVVVLSGFLGHLRVDGRYPACFDAVLAKPCSIDELVTAIAGGC